MDYEALLAELRALLQREQRLAYRALKLRLQLDDATLDALKDDLIYAKQLAVDEDGKVLVWTGSADTPPVPPPATSAPPDAERRQLTVLFCDLVDSTALASHLDPEDLRVVVRAYQDTCAKVIARFDGYIAQYLGDGLLVYFGYPLAHDDDAQRAGRAGLGMIEAVGQLNTRLAQEHGVQLAVRLGTHTGLVVVGEMGSGTRQEQLALGETPIIAYRLQDLAAPNTLVISAATFQLLGGFFACQPLGTPLLKGLAQPLAVYRVLYESMARSRLEAVGSAGLTPLVGREQEIGVLQERWAQVKDGVGQVVLLSGEAGIGKSRLVQVLTEQVAAEPQAWLTPCQCSPYYQHTALYPWIDLLERVALRFEREESPQQKLRKLEGFLVQYGLPLAEAVPLFAALLSLPLAADYAPLNLSSEQQKQQTLQALMTILLRIAAQQPVLVVMEDLHWVDPSTLELLSLLVDQGPTARILALLTFRPDFSPPWTGRAHCTQVTVNRLSRTQAAEVIRQVAHGKALPPEVVEQIVAKTDGVPLFVEELTKMVLESGLLQESEERYALTGPLPPLAIPATLHDSLMARLDRLATVKAMAQLGATLGREFSYELLRAVSPWDEGTLQRGLHQLVEAEFLYQRGLLPQATYLFKHALIQEAAYQSLLRSTRQQHHQHIAQVLEAQFPETVETQPELLAHHYTEAGHNDRAVDYWHKAGQKAMAHSAYVEAMAHLNTGLAQLVTLPETSELVQQELDMQITLGRGLMAMKGYGALEVGHAYSRAWALCQQVGETLHTTQSLWGLSSFHYVRRELQTAYELGTQCLTSAQRLEDAEGRISAHAASGVTLYTLGDLFAAREHLEQGIALYHPRQHPTLVARFAQDTGINCYNFVALTLWMLGYPHQALARSREMIALSQRLAHPYTLGVTLYSAARLHVFRREVEATLDLVEAFMQLAAEQAFAFLTGLGTIMRGWALVARGDVDAGLSDLREGITSVGSTGARVRYHLAYLAEAYAKAGRTDEGLRCVDEELALMDKTAERYYEAEFYRLKGILLLSQPLDHQAEAEVCFQQALTIARRQQAKSWELRAATSLARLWQHQDKRKEAYELLDQVYHWFTEGFDTTDLQETKTLLDELR